MFQPDNMSLDIPRFQIGFYGRNQFAETLNERGLVGKAVEVGSHRGEFASSFISSWKGEMLYCVDPWDNLPDYEDQASELWGGAETRQEDYEEAVASLKEFSDRTTLMRTTSSDAVRSFPDSFFDFVYIDGNHSYEHVVQDHFLWWNKVKSGGILAGHDFIIPRTDNGSWSRFIQYACLEFSYQNNLTIWLVPEADYLPWSYYFEKP